MRVNGEFVGIGGSAEIVPAVRTDVHADPTFETVVLRLEAVEKAKLRLVPASEIRLMIAAVGAK